jgi:pilus assembly protein CpaE
LSANLQILVASPDPKLRPELKDALAGLTGLNPVLHFAADFRQAAETARSHRPDLALVEMQADLRPLRQLVEELAAATPETAVAGVFQPSIFAPDVSEAAFLIEAIRAGARDFLRRPLSSADLGQLIDRLQHRPGRRPDKLGKVVSFMSNKGGVGKSTMAVNVACGLARERPGRVLLVDASLQMGVCATTLDLRPQTTLFDTVREWDRLDETLLRQLATPHACGLHLLAAPADAEEAAQIDDGVMSRVLTLARRAYDYVVVDTFPLLDRVVLAVLDLSDRAYIVLESVVPTVLGAVKLIALFDRLGFSPKRQRIILNRYDSGLGNLNPRDVANRLGRSVDFVLPYQKKLIAAANLGRPYVLQASRYWGFGKALGAILDDLAGVKTAARPARADRRDGGSVNGAVTEKSAKKSEAPR